MPFSFPGVYPAVPVLLLVDLAGLGYTMTLLVPLASLLSAPASSGLYSG